MECPKSIEREKHHTPNHALRDSISLSYFFSLFDSRKRKHTRFLPFHESPTFFYNIIRFLFVLMCLWPANIFGQLEPVNSAREFVIVLDPGHGGYDSGTVNKEGRFEKNINLYVAKYVKYYLKKYAPEIKVILTRRNDEFVSLKRRPYYALVSHADLFISLHCNHNPNQGAKGLEIYVQKTANPKAEKNLRKAIVFGKILEHHSEKKLNHESRGIMAKNLQVLRASIHAVPGVLVEMGFFSNDQESDYLNSNRGIKGLSLLITKSIIDYFEQIET